MILVIDANVLFSALIKDSTTADLIFNEDFKIYTCEFIVEEFLKYESEILNKTHRTKTQFIEIMHQLKEVITVIPKEEYVKFMEDAETISPDKNDELYFALALKMNSAIWSNDKKLKDQDKVKVYSTSELMRMTDFSQMQLQNLWAKSR